MQAKEVSFKYIKQRLWLLGVLKIPMIGYVRPRLIQLDDDNVAIKIKLRRRTKNHLGSMYFGALAIGADLAAGVHAFYFSEKFGTKISLAFKGFSGEFLKRAESDVIFRCESGAAVLKAFNESKSDGERKNIPIPIKAFDANGDHVATIEMILSIKAK